jgi:hypothetical protein
LPSSRASSSNVRRVRLAGAPRAAPRHTLAPQAWRRRCARARRRRSSPPPTARRAATAAAREFSMHSTSERSWPLSAASSRVSAVRATRRRRTSLADTTCAAAGAPTPLATALPPARCARRSDFDGAMPTASSSAARGSSATVRSERAACACARDAATCQSSARAQLAHHGAERRRVGLAGVAHARH